MADTATTSLTHPRNCMFGKLTTLSGELHHTDTLCKAFRGSKRNPTLPLNASYTVSEGVFPAHTKTFMNPLRQYSKVLYAQGSHYPHFSVYIFQVSVAPFLIIILSHFFFFLEINFLIMSNFLHNPCLVGYQFTVSLKYSKISYVSVTKSFLHLLL